MYKTLPHLSTKEILKFKVNILIGALESLHLNIDLEEGAKSEK